MKNTWIGDSVASCHITNDNNGMYDVINIDELIQGNSRIMPTKKKDKLRVTVCQVNGEEHVQTLCPLKFCPLAGMNLFSLTCKLLQRNKISSDETNNIIVNTPSGNIILDHQSKTHDGWVTGVNFLWNSINIRAVSATALVKQNINNLHVEFGHPSEAIMRSTTKALRIYITGTFNPCEDCTLGKVKQRAVMYLVCKFWGKGFSSI